MNITRPLFSALAIVASGLFGPLAAADAFSDKYREFQDAVAQKNSSASVILSKEAWQLGEKR